MKNLFNIFFIILVVTSKLVASSAGFYNSGEGVSMVKKCYLSAAHNTQHTSHGEEDIRETEETEKDSKDDLDTSFSWDVTNHSYHSLLLYFFFEAQKQISFRNSLVLSFSSQRRFVLFQNFRI